MNIEGATAITLQIFCFPKTCDKLRKLKMFRKWALAHPIFTSDRRLFMLLAFDLSFAVVLLKVVIGSEKIYLLAL